MAPKAPKKSSVNKLKISKFLLQKATQRKRTTTSSSSARKKIDQERQKNKNVRFKRRKAKSCSQEEEEQLSQNMETENSSSSSVTGRREEDCISKLPDDLLHRILSFLDMKEVVQTSTLSSRWRYLWISIPTLDINQTVFLSRNSMTFVKFVDKVLQTRTTSIQKLELYCKCDYYFDDDRDDDHYFRDNLIETNQLNTWIVDAVRLNVSVLDLQIEYMEGEQEDRSLDLPLCLFDCNTLTSLKLCFTDLIYILDLSMSDEVCPTALKTLHLRSLFLTAEENTDSFFSRCPVLETLIITDCIFEDDYNSNYLPSSILTCETLVSLELAVFSEDVPIFNDIPDSVNLPSLKSLVVEGYPLFGGESNINLFFSNCPSLESLNLCFSNHLHVHNDVFFRYVFKCNTLVNLYVRQYICIPDAVDLPCLKTLSLKSLCFGGGGITDNFFLGCPVLETLIILECTITDSFFFWSKSLTKLVLKMHGANGSLISLPSDSMSLPALKTLHLESFLLNDEDSINDLLTRCPVLESLTIMRCEFTRVNLNLSFHKLSHLKLVRNKSVACYDSNYASENYGFKINAPNLTSFILKDYYMPDDYIIENLSSIVKVDIKFEEQSTYFDLPEGKKQLCARQMMKILGVLCNVKDLALSEFFLEVVSGALDLPDSPIIQFWNLRCLKLITWRTMNCAHAVMYLLECSPNIESLSVEFAMGISQIPSSFPSSKEKPIGQEYWQERLSLSCMLHHLTCVKLQDITGCYFELKFVEFLLKNALSLQELMICFAEIWGQRYAKAESRVVKLSEELLSLPRASASVEILIYHPGSFTKRLKKLN